MVSNIVSTTATEKELQKSILNNAEKLQELVSHIIEELKHNMENAMVPVNHDHAVVPLLIDELMKKTYEIIYEIGQIKGAILTRKSNKHNS